LSVWDENLYQIGEWITIAMPLSALIIAGTGLATSQTRRQHLFLFLSAGLFCLALAAIGSVLYPRYILPAWVPILFAAGLSLSQHRQPREVSAQHQCVALTLITCLWGAFFAFQYVRNPAYAPLTTTDRHQYVENVDSRATIWQRLCTSCVPRRSDQAVSFWQARCNRALFTSDPKIYLNDDPRVAFIDIDMQATNARQRLGDMAAQRSLYMALDAEEVEAFQHRNSAFPNSNAYANGVTRTAP
jgi:hypothetical protein